MKEEELERLYKSGKMPKYAYYQQSRKDVYTKWKEQRQELLEACGFCNPIADKLEEVLDELLKPLIDECGKK